MVWAGFGNGGKTNLAFPTGRMKTMPAKICWILISTFRGSDWRSILDFSAGQCYY
jgi:hypothetical protein